MSAVRFLLLLLCLSLSPPCLLSITEAEALLAFKISMSNTEFLDSWKPNTDPCKDKWEGVFCEKQQPVIIRLHLTKMSLSGSVDVSSIAQIPNLKTLSLSNNSFSGPIPPFNTLKGLRSLYISSNKFSGEIPDDFFDGTTLRRLWLSDNEFSGKIPKSLGTLKGLMALHLERNKFTGSIPEISQDTLTELDMSGNMLEGQVPESMVRFGADAFKDNSGVCGKPVSKKCSVVRKNGNNVKVTIGIMVGIVVIMTIVLIVTTIKKSQNNNDEAFDVYNNKEPTEDVVEVRVQGTSRSVGAGSARSMNSGGFGSSVTSGGGSVLSGGGSRKSSVSDSSKKGSGGDRKGSQGKNAAIGDLTVINNEKGTFGLADLMKASAEVLGNGALGSAYKAVMSNGVSVVVKRIRDMNKLGKDDFDAAIRRIGKLRHKNILTPLAYHFRKEEKLVVSEYVPKGSLLYVLHGDRGLSHADLNWPMRLRVIKGIASGVQYLYAELSDYELPHGNLKSSNIFLGSNYEPLLADYGFSRMVTPTQAAQGLFAYKSPESVESQQVSSKGDVYCLGIVILEMLTGKFPSQYLNTGKGGTNVIQWVRTAIEEKKEAGFLDPEIASSTNSLDAMIQLLQLGASCTETDPNKRPTMEDAIKRIQEIQA
ncbi:pollen receptor-like kinase 3 [Chenopodium quinoa]|uniref:Protein kinase domain-containing protein n=1 Tax=Chenopodium quinoa TaxID=63459 RepID=A0A803M8R9_CHEQI|nr:pollen receptor-like kinase 3 [Chenopodium quinoa]